MSTRSYIARLDTSNPNKRGKRSQIENLDRGDRSNLGTRYPDKIAMISRLPRQKAQGAGQKSCQSSIEAMSRGLSLLQRAPVSSHPLCVPPSLDPISLSGCRIFASHHEEGETRTCKQ